MSVECPGGGGAGGGGGLPGGGAVPNGGEFKVLARTSTLTYILLLQIYMKAYNTNIH